MILIDVIELKKQIYNKYCKKCIASTLECANCYVNKITECIDEAPIIKAEDIDLTQLKN